MKRETGKQDQSTYRIAHLIAPCPSHNGNAAVGSAIALPVCSYRLAYRSVLVTPGILFIGSIPISNTLFDMGKLSNNNQSSR